MIEDEKELLQRWRNGDETAFNRMVLAHQQKVYMLALRMVGNHADAADISQMAFIRAYKGLKDFRGESTLSTWLYRITYNLCLRHLRSARLKRLFSLDLVETGEMESASVADEIIESEFQAELRKALANLPPQQKTVFTLHHFQGLKLREVAEVMELKLGTVKALHYFAVRKLRDKLKEWR
jgi:RNA polymerase sigma-70 factor (ECF subfamily)